MSEVTELEKVLSEPELLEILSDIEHTRWSGWEEWRRQCVLSDNVHPSGEPFEKRWRRLEETPYSRLTEKERESDRIEARKGLAAIREYLAARAAQGRTA